MSEDLESCIPSRCGVRLPDPLSMDGWMERSMVVPEREKKRETVYASQGYLP